MTKNLPKISKLGPRQQNPENHLSSLVTGCTFNGMSSLIDAYARLAPRASELLLTIKEIGINKIELATRLDVSSATASLMISVSKAFTPEELGQGAGLSFEKFRIIATSGKKIANPDINREQFRNDLIEAAHELSVDELKEHIVDKLAALNKGYNRARKWHLRYAATADPDGMSHMLMKMPAEQAEQLRTSLTPEARTLVQQGAAVDEAEGHAKALIRRVLHGYDLTKLEHVEGWEDPNNPRDLRQRPCIIIPDWEHTAHIDGTVVDTNGVVIPIKDLVDRRIAKYGFAVTVYNDANGVMRPHDVLPIKRLADADDRFISILSHLVCQHPDCRVPAVRCEIHHIQSFASGGPTTPENLCPLCRVHNLLNDDKPDEIRHGRVFNDPKTGLTWYEMPDGRIRRNRARSNERGLSAYCARMCKEALTELHRPGWMPPRPPRE